jgi:putative FmdB family regulatory protein
MPIYEYICEKCGSHTEVIQKISDAPLKRCSKCRGKLEKTVSRTSFQLKGSGWYVTDYSRGGSASGKGSSAGKNESASADKSDSGKTAGKKSETVASTAASADSD